MTPSETLAAFKPLNIAFPLGNGGVLRSQEAEGFGKEGTVGRGKKEGKEDAQKVLRYIYIYIYIYVCVCVCVCLFLFSCDVFCEVGWFWSSLNLAPNHPNT